MAVRVLRPGEALALTDLGDNAVTELAVGMSAAGQLPDLVALLVSPAGKVRSDDDLVFYNNPASTDGAVTWAGASGGAEWVRIAPVHLDADVDRVVLGCAGGLLDTAAAAQMTVTLTNGPGRELAGASFAAESGFRAMILLEVYRRRGVWRCRLLAQGYAGGLAALVTEFGVDVDESGDAAPARPAPTDAPQRTPTPATPTHRPKPATAPSAATPQPYAPAQGRPTFHPPGPYPAPPPTQPPGWPDESNAPYSPSPLPDPYVQSPATHGPPSQAPPQGPPPQWAPPDIGRRGGLFTSRKRAQLEAQNAELNLLLATSGALDNATIAAERQRLAGEVAALAAAADRRRADLAGLEARLQQVRAAIAVAEGDAELTEVGIYNYRHRLDDSIAYKARIDWLRDRIKATAKAGHAVTGNTNWTVNGSLAQGRKMVNEVSKLMLRAYNADADHAVRTMRAYKLDSALARLDTTRSTIARLGTTMNIAVTDEYHRLRRQELELTADMVNKVEEEKERQRALREQQREQQRADAEYVREQGRLERDRDKYADALTRLEAAGQTQKAIEIRSQLTSVKAALDQLAYRRANMRLGYVYVISNIGAFGQRMVKIGMTRRVDPLDRVRELGDASVPFRFDVHALIFSEDAVALETALHQRFAEHKVNRVNQHREFFYVTPGEVRQALADLGSQYLVQYTEDIDAPEWRQSGGPERALLPT